jgi:hypothetical protein
MTIEEYRLIVKTIVNESTGIKAVELATQVAIKTSNHFPMQRTWDESSPSHYDIWEDALTPLIKNGEIIELEYILPGMDYRIKSIFFPRGTILKFKDGEK